MGSLTVCPQCREGYHLGCTSRSTGSDSYQRKQANSSCPQCPKTSPHSDTIQNINNNNHSASSSHSPKSLDPGERKNCSSSRALLGRKKSLGKELSTNSTGDARKSRGKGRKSETLAKQRRKISTSTSESRSRYCYYYIFFMITFIVLSSSNNPQQNTEKNHICFKRSFDCLFRERKCPSLLMNFFFK